MTIKLKGELEIDHERGVIYFTNEATGTTIFRICGLPTPIPLPYDMGWGMLDVSHMIGVNWKERGITR